SRYTRPPAGRRDTGTSTHDCGAGGKQADYSCRLPYYIPVVLATPFVIQGRVGAAPLRVHEGGIMGTWHTSSPAPTSKSASPHSKPPSPCSPAKHSRTATSPSTTHAPPTDPPHGTKPARPPEMS